MTLLETYLHKELNSPSFDDYTIGTFVFTFNNRQMTVIERFKVSHYHPAFQYLLLISVLMIITIYYVFIRPIKEAIDDSNAVTELINQIISVETPQKKKVSFFSVFLHRCCCSNKNLKDEFNQLDEYLFKRSTQIM